MTIGPVLLIETLQRATLGSAKDRIGEGCVSLGLISCTEIACKCCYVLGGEFILSALSLRFKYKGRLIF